MSGHPAERGNVMQACSLALMALLPALLSPAESQRFGPFDSPPCLLLSGPASSSICVAWNTADPGPSSLAWGVTPLLGDTITLPGPVCHHHVTLTGLQPATDYYYRVLPDGGLYCFETLQDPPGPSPPGFSFTVMGDSHCRADTSLPVMDLASPWEASFWMHTGDLVEIGDDTGNWWSFFRCADTLCTRLPTAPCPDNHEYPFWPFDSLFCPYGRDRFFSFDCANGHFIVLDSDQDILGPQLDWLECDLQAASTSPSIDWIIAAFHYPPTHRARTAAASP